MRRLTGLVLFLVLLLGVVLWPGWVGAQPAAGMVLLATINSPTTTTYTDTTCPKATPAVSCTYQVLAVNAIGDSTPATLAGSTTQTILTVANSGPAGTIVITWIAPPSTAANAPSGYLVYTGQRLPNAPTGLVGVSN